MWRYRNAAHYLVGMIIVMSSMVNWVLPIIGTALFLTYEVNEDWHLHDQAYQDILEAMLGFFVATAGLIIWRFIT